MRAKPLRRSAMSRSKPCHHFARGSCKFGSKCHFSHDKQVRAKSSVQDKLQWIHQTFTGSRNIDEILDTFSDETNLSTFTAHLEAKKPDDIPDWRILNAILPTFSDINFLESVRKGVKNKLLLTLLREKVLPSWRFLLDRSETDPDALVERLERVATIFTHLMDLTRMALFSLPIDNLSAKSNQLSGRSGNLDNLVKRLLEKKEFYVQEIQKSEREAQEAQQIASCRKKEVKGGILSLYDDDDLLQLESEEPFRSIRVIPIASDIYQEIPRDTSTSRLARRGLNEEEVDDEENLPPIPDAKFGTIPLPMNKTRDAFPNIDTYLSTHFRLLREDCLFNMKKGLQEIKRTGEIPTNLYDKFSLMVYHDVQFVAPIITRRCLGWTIKFRPSFKPRDWSKFKHLMIGSLLCLVPIDDKSFQRLIFATVLTRTEKELERTDGPFIDIEISEPIASRRMNDDLSIGAVGHNAGDMIIYDPFQNYSMFESSVYFEAHRSVLETLQSTDPTKLPFAHLLRGASKVVHPPQYISTGRSLELSGAFPGLKEIRGDTKVDVLTPWPQFSHSLNESQLSAVKHALTNEIAIIQGPPGCGKTYVGVLLSRILIDNSAEICGKRSSRPILYICYTNHALDQLLEHILQFESRIVRIGGRSRSPQMKEKNITEWRREYDQSMRYASLNVTAIYGHMLGIQRLMEISGSYDDTRMLNLSCGRQKVL